MKLNVAELDFVNKEVARFRNVLSYDFKTRSGWTTTNRILIIKFRDNREDHEVKIPKLA
jgi:hypothetical protein